MIELHRKTNHLIESQFNFWIDKFLTKLYLLSIELHITITHLLRNRRINTKLSKLNTIHIRYILNALSKRDVYLFKAGSTRKSAISLHQCKYIKKPPRVGMKAVWPLNKGKQPLVLINAKNTLPSLSCFPLYISTPTHQLKFQQHKTHSSSLVIFFYILFI